MVGLPNEANMNKIISELLGDDGEFRSVATQPAEHQFWLSEAQQGFLVNGPTH